MGDGHAAQPGAKGIGEIESRMIERCRQGLRVLVLVTTNEPLGLLHPAVSRPGRCAAAIELPAFPPAEAAGWLAERGADPVEGEATLAELYAYLRGGEPPRVKHPVGF